MNTAAAGPQVAAGPAPSLRAIPAKVRSGFASGIAQNKEIEQFCDFNEEQKCSSGNSSKGASRFGVRNCAKTTR
jgi:hypothetical protein